MERSSREEWAKRVARWGDSGQTAAEFCAEEGINPRTLTFWKWRLGRQRAGRQLQAPAFVEVVAAASDSAVAGEVRGVFEVVLRNGTLIRVPARFDAGALKTVVRVLEER